MNGNAVKINAILSLPRLGFNDAWGCVTDALQPFGIPVSRFFGVFWGQCMQRALLDATKTDTDWLLCIDYDSVFTPQHVDKLLSTFSDNPHMDALAAMQVKRASYSPLLFRRGDTQITFDKGTPFRVDTAHFGLTVIRVDKLRKLSKPLFHSQPDPNGDWGEGRVDEDIYFWNKWFDEGNNVYVDPRIRIGHLELMVTEFKDDFSVQHTNVSKWREREYGAGGNGFCLRAQPLPEGPDSPAAARGGGDLAQTRASA